MREEIRINAVLTYDADADASPAEQCADVLADLGRLLDPDSESSVELIRAEIGGHTGESAIYSGESRGPFTRAGFAWFDVARVGEWTGSHCSPIGWRSSFRDGAPDSIFWTVYAGPVGGPSVAVGDFKSRAIALLMAEALADGRAVSCADSMLPGFRVTWETYTESSVADGDAAARGFVVPPYGAREPLARVLERRAGDSLGYMLRDALAALESAGDLESLEPDSSDWTAARSVSAHYRLLDGETVGETLTIHFPEITTPASRARLVRLICKN